MKKQNCHFQLHDFLERKVFIENAWCEVCDEPNIGILSPAEFEVYGNTFVQGFCRKCGTKIVSEIIEKNVEE